jgi:hypothetical protein
MTTFTGLPAALKPYASQTRWVLWRWETRKGKRTKPPRCAFDSSRYAKSDDPTTWSDFDTALQAYKSGKGAGIGLCLLNSGLSAFDVDCCRDPTTGDIEPAARKLIKRAQSYVEITPSGTGLRILLASTGPQFHRKQPVPGANGMTIETYRDCERFITVTGNALPEATTQIADDHGLIDEVVAKLDEAAKKAKQASGKTKRARSRKLDLDDIVKNGEGGHFNGDRSRAVWWCINEMMRRGQADAAIADALLDRANKISEHCYDQVDPQSYVQRLGTKFDGPAGLREVLTGKRELFVETATERLLTYALGRGVEEYDYPVLRKIVRGAGADDYRWSSIILGIVNSAPFQLRRTGDGHN